MIDANTDALRAAYCQNDSSDTTFDLKAKAWMLPEGNDPVSASQNSTEVESNFAECLHTCKI